MRFYKENFRCLNAEFLFMQTSQNNKYYSMTIRIDN